MDKYIYDINVNMISCKHWQFIESEFYKIILNNGGFIRINLNISSTDPLDVVEIRFYNICNNGYGEGIGKMYAYVDGKSALPTIGITPTIAPMYIAIPKCPTYGTTKTDVWDTDDTRKIGNTEYVYIYKGNSPLKIKTLELYVVKKY